MESLLSEYQVPWERAKCQHQRGSRSFVFGGDLFTEVVVGLGSTEEAKAIEFYVEQRWGMVGQLGSRGEWKRRPAWRSLLKIKIERI